ncbi:MAG: glycosyltransferase, partial [Fusobacteriaceae bacterium]
MKKNIVFRSGSLRMGGLERVLIETLQNIDLDKFHVTLFIEDDSGKDNIFLKDVPEEIKVYFLKPEPLMRKTENHRLKKSNLFHKLMYNYMMEKERRVVIKNTVKYLKELGEIDVLVDYDWGATKYIEKLPVKKSVVWIHNSIPKLLGERKKKIERFGKRLA